MPSRASILEALTMHLRDFGAQKAAISTEDLDPAHLLARVQASPNISEHNFVPDVSVDAPHVVPATSKKRFNVVAYDCGEKNGILQGLAANGCEVTVVPWNTPAKDALAYNPDGIFFSNGPGDPEQVDATQEAARGVWVRFPSLVSAWAIRCSPLSQVRISRNSNLDTMVATNQS